MGIRAKTKVRVVILAVGLLALVGVLTVVFVLVQSHRDKQAEAARVAGMEAFEAGDHFKALNLLGRYLQRFDREADPEAWLRYAQARQRVREPNNKHMANAMARLRMAVEWHPEREDLRRELMQLYLKRYYNSEAADTADSLLSRRPDDPEALLAKAVALQRLNRGDEALRLARRIAEADPRGLDGHLLTLRLMSQLERPDDELIEYAQAQHEARPDDPRTGLLMGFAHALAQRREEATRWLVAAADAPAMDKAFVTTLVEMLDNQAIAQFGTSLALLERADAELGDPDLRRMLMRRYWETGRTRDLAEKLAGLDPRDSAADGELLGLRALALLRLGRDEEAAPIVEALAARLQDDASQAWGLFLRDVVMPESVPPAETIAVTQRALQRDPLNPYIRMAQGEAYARLEEYDAALRAWQGSAHLAPAWAAPYTAMARVMLATDREQEALPLAVAAVQRSTQSDAVVAWLLARYANLEGSRNDSRQALLDEVSRMLEQAPGQEQMLALKAQLLLDLDRRDEAATLVRETLESDPAPSEETLLKLALIAERGELGLSAAVFDRSGSAHGVTPRLAAARAAHKLRQGRPEQGLEALREARARKEKGDAAAWDLAWAQYLELTGSRDARAAWVALGDAYKDNLPVQQAALRARSAWGDPGFIDRAIDRTRTLTGDEGLAWRIARARWLLENSDSPARAAEAVTLLSEAVKTARGLVEAHLLLASAYERLGNMAGAAEHLTAAAAARPESAAIAIKRAQVELRRNNLEAARDQVELALRDPRIAPPERRQAAALLARLGRADEALRVLERLERDGEADRLSRLQMAQLYRARGDDARAEAVLAELLKAPSAEVLAYAAEVFAQAGRHDEARQALARLGEVKVPPAQRELILAHHASRHATIEEAERHYLAATKAAPRDADVWQSLVRFYVRTRRPDAALGALERAVAAAPDDAALSLLRGHLPLLKEHRDDLNFWALALAALDEPAYQSAAGQALALLGRAKRPGADVPDALRQARQLADQNPRFIELQNVLARLYLATGRTAEAAEVAQRAMHASPAAADSARLAAETFAAAGRWGEALEAARLWRQRAPQDAAASDLMIAQALVYTGEPAQALSHLAPYVDAALAAPTEQSGVVTIYTRALIGAGQADKAAQVLAPLLGESPMWRSLWIGYALTLPQPDAAAAWLERVSPAVPADANERLQLAQAWATLAQRSGRPEHTERARAIVGEVSRGPDAGAGAWALIGTMHQAWGDAASAEAAYRRSLEINPRQPLVQNNLAMVLAGSGRSLPEALSLAQKAVAEGGEVPDVLDTLAHVQRKTRDYPAAVSTMKRVVGLDPSNPQWRLNLAEILLESGQFEEAGAALDAEPLNSQLRPLSGEQQRRLEALRGAAAAGNRSASVGG